MATTTPRGRPSNEELLRKPPQEILRWLQKVEAENLKLMFDHGSMMKEINRRMQVHLLEIRGLKEVNQRLQDDNQELRDLCCFLDDDRQKGRKLAREWQRFGRYTASVMRQEVSAYQAKLRELESKQQELIRDNLELKELCLYLDDERSRALCTQCGSPLNGRRDDGDGSSSSTNNEELGLLTPATLPPGVPVSQQSRASIEEAIQRHRSIINEQVLQYIRNLEKRIQLLELEKKGGSGTGENTPEKQKADRKISGIPHSVFNGRDYSKSPNPNSSPSEGYVGVARPEAVVHAMKVLEVHEQLDKNNDSDLDFEDLAEGEKALVREMCNVVWRKLEDGPS